MGCIGPIWSDQPLKYKKSTTRRNLFYLKYIDKNDQAIKVNEIKNEIVGLESTKGNLISDISYESKDFEGRKYLIKSKQGIFNKDNPNMIEMKMVNAKIILIDGTTDK